MATRATGLALYRTSIPMRGFEHAAASRELAEAFVARVTFSDGSVGWGETLPRPYVTGETMETVAGDIPGVIWPVAAALDFDEGASALAAILRAPADGRCVNAAACAIELAAADRLLRREGDTALKALAGGGSVAGRIGVRVSGVLGSRDPSRTARRLRLMRWFGLRDFKLKLGFGEETDEANLRVVVGRIGRAIAAGKCTLRVDVNGGWEVETTPERVAALKAAGVCAVEQPVFCGAGELAELARRCPLPLLADESLVTEADARELLAAPRHVWWNVRISKNGGLVAAARLAAMAAEASVTVVAGCMVGESGLLSAAQRRLLQVAGDVRFVEGSYGRFLLADDLTKPSPRFGYGGRLKVLRGAGLGVAVDPAKLARYGETVGMLGA